MSNTAVKNDQQMATCSETMGYDEYPIANWHKGEEYGYKDDGRVLTLGSETGSFHFIGNARDFMRKSFNIE
jgi:hypothetical protein